MIGVGEKVRFVPSFDIGGNDDEETLKRKTVTGTVVYIHSAHQYFTCEYDLGRSKMRESFKFADIGKTVKLCRKR